MLVHYHFHCKTAILHSWQHKCSFIITSIVRLLTYTADNTNARCLHCKTAILHSWQHKMLVSLSLSIVRLLIFTQLTTQMLVHYHFHCKTANLHSWQHKCSFIIPSIVRLLILHSWQHKCSFIITSIVRLLTLHSWQTQMLIHYHFHWKTANLHSWQHKCSFIITSIVRLLTYTADNTNARSLSLPL